MIRKLTWRSSATIVGSPLTTALLAMLVLALALWSACDNPQSPAPGSTPDDTTFHGSYDPSGSVLEFQLETPNSSASLRLQARDLRFDAATTELHAQVSIRNVGTETVRGPLGILLGSLDPTSVWPSNAEGLACPACATCECPFSFLFHHSNTYGSDGLLSPGETSTPVEWIFHDPAGESFSFRAAPMGEEEVPASTISGTVFADMNGDGRRQDLEPGIVGARVALFHGDVKLVALTSGVGRFDFPVSEPGLYEVAREADTGCTPTSPSRLQVLIVRRPDGTLSGYADADFGCGGGGPVPSFIVVVGLVYEDLNRDGQHQDGEPGLRDVLVDGATPHCPTFAPIQARTDETGRYRLELPVCMPPTVITRAAVPGFFDTTPNPVLIQWSAPDSTLPGPRRPPVPPASEPFADATVDFGVARIDPGR